MSKSKGNVVDPFALVDALRRRRGALFLYCAKRRSAATSRFSEEKIAQRYNADLGNDLGNLRAPLARDAGALSRRHRPGRRPIRRFGARFEELGAARRRAHLEICDFATRSKRRGNWSPRSIVVSTNATVGSAQAGDAPKRSTRVLYELCEGLRWIALLLHPFMPRKAGGDLDAARPRRRRQTRIGATALVWGKLAGGTRTQTATEPLFPRIDAPEAAKPA